MVVLSSEEKYCYAKAAFEPVIEHLAGLPSPAFYTALRSWKQIVLRGMKEVEASSSDATSVPDESSGSDASDSLADDMESDMTSDLAPADFIDSINMIRELEKTQHVLSIATSEPCAAPQTEVPLEENKVSDDSQDQCAANSGSGIRKNYIESVAQTLTQSWGRLIDQDSSTTAPSKVKVLLTKAAVSSKEVKHVIKADRKRGLIEVLKLPQPKPRRNQRKKLTQNRVSPTGQLET
jgi:hypothetical protein